MLSRSRSYLTAAILLLAAPAGATDWWCTGIASPNTSGTRYAPVGAPISLGTLTVEGTGQLPAAFAATATDLNCIAATAPGAGKSFAITLRNTAVDTALTCTIADTNTTCSQTGQSVSIASGDLLVVSDVPAGTPTVSNHRCCISVN